MASSILAWRIPWTEEPGRLQSTGSQRVGYCGASNTFAFKPQPEIPGRGCQEPCLYVTFKTSLLPTCSLLLFKPTGNVAAGHPLATSSTPPLCAADYFLLSSLRALWGTAEGSCQFLHGPGEHWLPQSALPLGVAHLRPGD